MNPFLTYLLLRGAVFVITVVLKMIGSPLSPKVAALSWLYDMNIFKVCLFHKSFNVLSLLLPPSVLGTLI